MQIYQPVTTNDMLRFAKREPGAPRCIRCGERFHLFFSGGRLTEQRCACGLVYRIESLAANDAIDADLRDHVDVAEAWGLLV